MKRLSIILFLLLLFTTIQAQDSNTENTEEEETEEKKESNIRFQGDSRRTFINRKVVNITGVRLGYAINEKYEAGIGLYSSNLLGFLGKEVKKDYVDNSLNPPESFPASIGFHYISLYGEYLLLDKGRLRLTANTQFGLGRVYISFDEVIGEKEEIRENKTLVEHSIKADVEIFKWLRIMGGAGYRYLLAGEPQIKDAFNAPILIIGFSVDLKKLFKKTTSSL